MATDNIRFCEYLITLGSPVAMDCVLSRMGRGGEVAEVCEGEDSGGEVEEGGEGAGLAGEAGAEKGEDVGDVAVDVGVVEEGAGLRVAEVYGVAEADSSVVDGHDDAAGVVEGAGNVHVAEPFEQRRLQGIMPRSGGCLRLLEKREGVDHLVKGVGIGDVAVADGAVVDGGNPPYVELAGGGEDVSLLHPAVEGLGHGGVEVVEGLADEAGVLEEPGESVDGGSVFLYLGGAAVAGALCLVLKDGVEVGDDAGTAVDRLVGGADVSEGVAEDGGGAVELALEEGPGGEERCYGGGVVVEEEGHEVGVDGPDGLGDGELPPAVGDGQDDGFLRNGYEPVAEGHVVILDRRIVDTGELRYCFFDRRTGVTGGLRYYFLTGEQEQQESCATVFSDRRIVETGELRYCFFGQENSRNSRCFGLSLICRYFRSPVAPVLLSETRV